MKPRDAIKFIKQTILVFIKSENTTTVATLNFLWFSLFFGCEEAHMIRSITITPEGEPTRHLGQTTFNVSVKVDHDERDTDGNVVRVNVLQPIPTPPFIQRPTPKPAEVVEETPIVEEPIVEEPRVSFKNDILPIFKAHCQQCHRTRPGHTFPMNNLDLTNYEGLMKGAPGGGPVVDPGWSKSSRIYWKIHPEQHDIFRMPLGKPPLSDEQIQLILDWIDAGAKDN